MLEVVSLRTDWTGCRAGRGVLSRLQGRVFSPEKTPGQSGEWKRLATVSEKWTEKRRGLL